MLTDCSAVLLVLENVFRKALELSKANTKIKLSYEVKQNQPEGASQYDVVTVLIFKVKFSARKSDS